jgi:hypothetical protein
MKQPVLPPVFRPQSGNSLVQAKARVQVPPVYKPQAASSVLQARTPLNAPPVAAAVRTVQAPPKAGGAVIQRRTFLYADGSTMHLETKGTPWTPVQNGQQVRRSPALGRDVDLYKKEVLTYIAGVARERLFERVPDVKGAVPHVAVVIRGVTCHIGINGMDIAPETAAEVVKSLKYGALKAIDHFRKSYRRMREYYGSDPANAGKWEDRGERINEEALYVALRWAEKVRFVDVQGVVPLIEGGAMHGEMLILNNAFDRPNMDAVNERMRVLRVGGTKTPCFDCASAMEVHKVSSFKHSNMKYVKVKGKDWHRRTWTMSGQYGPGFPNWTDPQDVNTYRERYFAPEGARNFEYEQEQNANVLAAEMQRVNAYRPEPLVRQPNAMVARQVPVNTRAGLTFSVGKVHKQLRQRNLRSVRPAAVYMTAVLEYLTAEMLELAGNSANRSINKRITPRNLKGAVSGDDELKTLLRNVGVDKESFKKLMPPETGNQ